MYVFTCFVFVLFLYLGFEIASCDLTVHALLADDMSTVGQLCLIIRDPPRRRGWWAVQQSALCGCFTWRPFQLEVISPTCDIQCVVSGLPSLYDLSALYSVDVLAVYKVPMIVATLIIWTQPQQKTPQQGRKPPPMRSEKHYCQGRWKTKKISGSISSGWFLCYICPYHNQYGRV